MGRTKSNANNPVPTEKTKYPVPQWMDEDMKSDVETMDMFKRIELAERFERRAAQLRDMKQKPIKRVDTVTIPLLPAAKRALIFYAEAHGANCGEKNLEMGAVWFLERALPLIANVSTQADWAIRYRDAEAVEDSDFNERMISAALEQWKARRLEESD